MPDVDDAPERVGFVRRARAHGRATSPLERGARRRRPAWRASSALSGDRRSTAAEIPVARRGAGPRGGRRGGRRARRAFATSAELRVEGVRPARGRARPARVRSARSRAVEGDDLVVEGLGSAPRASAASTFDAGLDHRMAMAGAVAGVVRRRRRDRGLRRRRDELPGLLRRTWHPAMTGPRRRHRRAGGLGQVDRGARRSPSASGWRSSTPARCTGRSPARPCARGSTSHDADKVALVAAVARTAMVATRPRVRVNGRRRRPTSIRSDEVNEAVSVVAAQPRGARVDRRSASARGPTPSRSAPSSRDGTSRRSSSPTPRSRST